jgi:hypothetical protein
MAFKNEDAEWRKNGWIHEISEGGRKRKYEINDLLRTKKIGGDVCN